LKDSFAVSRALDSFNPSWQLMTGLSMEKIWASFKPAVPSSIGHLEALSQLRGLADRFDRILWKVRAPIDSTASLRISIAKALEVVLFHKPDSAVFFQV
jgi:midasin